MLVKEFFTKYKNYFIAALVLLIFLFTILFLLSDNSPIRNAEKRAKEELKDLKKYNKQLVEFNTNLQDSIKILYVLAVNQNNKDTVFLNQIRYIKTKNDQEVNNIPNLTVDSNLRLNSDLSSEYRLSKDSI